MPCLLWWYWCSAQSPEHCRRSVNEFIREMGIIVVATFEQCGCRALSPEPAHVAPTTATEVKR